MQRRAAGSPSRRGGVCIGLVPRLQGEINYLVLRRNGSSADTERERKRE